LVFIFQGFINANFFHRDIGLGGSWYCPLPNGYSLLMTDVTDHGVSEKCILGGEVLHLPMNSRSSSPGLAGWSIDPVIATNNVTAEARPGNIDIR